MFLISVLRTPAYINNKCEIKGFQQIISLQSLGIRADLLKINVAQIAMYYLVSCSIRILVCNLKIKTG